MISLVGFLPCFSRWQVKRRSLVSARLPAWLQTHPSPPRTSGQGRCCQCCDPESTKNRKTLHKHNKGNKPAYWYHSLKENKIYTPRYRYVQVYLNIRIICKSVHVINQITIHLSVCVPHTKATLVLILAPKLPFIWFFYMLSNEESNIYWYMYYKPPVYRRKSKLEILRPLRT